MEVNAVTKEQAKDFCSQMLLPLLKDGVRLIVEVVN
jgi:hypothetical protein